MSCVHDQTGVPRCDFIVPLVLAMSGPGMGSECPKAVYNGTQASQHLLQVIVFELLWR